MRSRLGMFAYYQKRRVGGRTSHLARGDRVPIHLLTYLLSAQAASPLTRACPGSQPAARAADMTSKMVARSWSTSGSTGDKLLTGRSDELRDTGLIVLRQRVSDVERRCKKEWEKLEGDYVKTACCGSSS